MKLDVCNIRDQAFCDWLDWVLCVMDKRLEAIEKHIGIKTWDLQKAVYLHDIWQKTKKGEQNELFSPDRLLENGQHNKPKLSNGESR